MNESNETIDKFVKRIHNDRQYRRGKLNPKLIPYIEQFLEDLKLYLSLNVSKHNGLTMNTIIYYINNHNGDIQTGTIDINTVVTQLTDSVTKCDRGVTSSAARSVFSLWLFTGSIFVHIPRGYKLHTITPRTVDVPMYNDNDCLTFYNFIVHNLTKNN